MLWVHEEREDKDRLGGAGLGLGGAKEKEALANRDVVVNPAWWAGVREGDMLLMRSKEKDGVGSGAPRDGSTARAFLFIVPAEDACKTLSAQLQVRVGLYVMF